MSEMSTGAFAPETKFGTLEYWRDRAKKLEAELAEWKSGKRTLDPDNPGWQVIRGKAYIHIDSQRRIYMSRWQYQEILDLQAENTILRELVDGAEDIVGAFKPESPAQVDWKKEWLRKMRDVMSFE